MENNKIVTMESSVDASMFEVVGQDLDSLNEMSRPSISFWKDAFGRIKRDKVTMFFLTVLIIITTLSFLIPAIWPVAMNTQNYAYTNAAPFTSTGDHIFIFGTDVLGRDLFVRAFDGGRVSLTIAYVAVVINCVVGVCYGGIAGYFGGMLDNVMMRFVEILNGIPYLLLVIVFMIVLEPGMTTIIVAYSVVGWAGMARLVRGEVMRLKQQEFVICASTMGASSARIIFRHLVPNILSLVVVNLTLQIPSIIFTEAFLSFIGLGVVLPQASWGTLANEGIASFQRYPYQLIIPAVLISITMLSFNLVGDRLRDAFDPKLRR
ncbi:ABC transporter permease [Tannockella kyphosi]|uniref:ABC transporter permease n=1 Tax=Tannockella kyphosi TaxID=2899121 RepID=UPI0020138EBF|nr:ABC transporter permease [Tannockella kyphosi]